MIASSLTSRATLGRCSPIKIPGTPVWIGLNGPPLAWPGFGSKGSIWLGPPDIQSRMHALRRRGSAAVFAARVSSQPEAEPARAPKEARRSICRRVTRYADDDERSMAELPDPQVITTTMDDPPPPQ